MASWLKVLTILLVILLLAHLASSHPLRSEDTAEEVEENGIAHHREKRTVFGLMAFLLQFLNAIMGIALNDEINKQVV